MHLMKAVAIVITGIFALTMVDGEMLITPLFQAGVDVVFVSKNGTAQLNSFGQNRLDGALLNIVEHVKNHFSITLDHAEDRRLFTGQRAAPRCAFEPSASP